MVAQKDILKNYQKSAKEFRRRHEPELDACTKLTVPARRLFRTTNNRKTVTRTNLYSSIATIGLYNARIMIQRLAMPIGTSWFSLKALKDVGRIPLNIQLAIYRANQQMLDSLRPSGYLKAFGNALTDTLIYGNGVMVSHDLADGPRWHHVPLHESYFLYDEVYDRYYFYTREHDFTAEEIVNMYEGKGTIPKPVMDAVQKGHIETRFTVYECQYWNDDTDSFWFGTYFHNWDCIVEPTELHSQKYHILSWEDIPGEPWADGLIRQGLPHIQSSNQVRMLQLKHGEMTALGAWQAVGDSVVNWKNKVIEAGRVYNTAGELQPLTLPGNFAALDELLQREEFWIRQLLLMDIIPAPDDGVRTAFEIGKRFQLFLERAGAPALALENRIIQTLESHASSMAAAGLLDPIITNKGVVEFEVVSIIKRGAMLEEIQKELELIQLGAQVAEMTQNPTVLKAVKPVDWFRKALKAVNFDPDLMLSDDEMADLINKEVTQANAQNAMAMGGQMLQLAGGAQSAGLNVKNIPGVVNDSIDSTAQIGADLRERAAAAQ